MATRILVISASAAVLLAGCGKTPPSRAPVTTDESARFVNVRGDAEFVGDAACASCHENQWQGYQSHGMARSWYPMEARTAVETFPGQEVVDPRSGLRYRAIRTDEGFFQEEYRMDAQGSRVHELRRPMDFVMGSGNAARTYYAEEGGWYFQLPLTWYTRDGTWAFSPGYDVANKRFDRLVPDRCMACHNGYPDAEPFTDGKYHEVPNGIGCERCHGPGGPHVEARLAEPEVAGWDSTIVNPARLSIDLQLDVCQQCHLNGTVSVLRSGRSAYDFRPSQRLADYQALFSAPSDLAADAVGVISHADRMRRSACFVETADSGRPMTCVTCHDPHTGFRDQGAAYFDTACASCHERPVLDAPHGAVDGWTARPCSTCHMPSVAPDEAPHASFTDHWIRVPGQSEAPTAADLAGDGGLVPYFDRDRSGDDADRYTGIAYLVLGRQQGDSTAFRRGVDRLKAYLADRPEDAEAHFQAGYALASLGAADEAIRHLEESVRLEPDVPERLNTLAQAYEAAGRASDAVERLYRRALSIQPAQADIRVNLGRFLEASGRPDEALEEYRLATTERPWHAEAWYNLGTVLFRQGQLAPAEQHLEEAVRLRPDYVRALSNLALIRLQRGDEEGAVAMMERAADAGPDDAVALGNLGAFYLQRDDLERAVPLLRRALDADADAVDVLVNLALAYVQLDDVERAAPLVERALALQPGHVLALRIRAAL